MTGKRTKIISIHSILCAVLVLLLQLALARVHDIRDFGAIHDDDSLIAEQVNAQAFMDALVAANYTTGPVREVLVPANHTFGMLGVWGDNFTNINITIDGTIKLSKRHHHWPLADEDSIRDFMMFRDIVNVTFRGEGTVDGQGYMWWVREFLQRNKNPKGRPRLVYIRGARNLEFTGIRWLNSPKQHLNIKDVDTMHLHDFEIHVDYMGILELGELLLGSGGATGRGGLNGMTLPMFPLNTDGIDPAGKNILIERLNVTNFDDAVAVKSLNRHGDYATCTENVIVRDMNIWFSTGLSVGSVTPHGIWQGRSCVDNVQFMNVKFYHPLKAIYVKTNPGHTLSMRPGSGGKITNVLYENIEVHNPIWWSIYIGPQQQKQPDPEYDSPGCMLYPLVPCAT